MFHWLLWQRLPFFEFYLTSWKRILLSFQKIVSSPIILSLTLNHFILYAVLMSLLLRKSSQNLEFATKFIFREKKSWESSPVWVSSVWRYIFCWFWKPPPDAKTITIFPCLFKIPSRVIFPNHMILFAWPHALQKP